MGKKVPDVLLSGHHANIEKWRREQSILRTLRNRPELLEDAVLSKKKNNIWISCAGNWQRNSHRPETVKNKNHGIRRKPSHIY